MLQMECDQRDATLHSYHKENLQRSLPGLEDYRKKIDTSRPFSLVASGPSLERFYLALKADNDKPFVCAAKTARWLTDKGIKPDCSIHVHPFDQELKYIDPTVKTDYLVSTQCPPSVFEFLKNNKVYTLHTINSRTFIPPQQPVLNGGSNVATHALWAAYLLGFSTVKVYGVDFSYTQEATHVNKNSPQPDAIEVTSPHGAFLTSSRMVTMAVETHNVLVALNRQGVEVKVLGDGLLAWMLKDPDVYKAIIDNQHKLQNQTIGEQYGSVSIQSN